MSGYLQRLVQTAARPVQTVHPFAGSIYAPGDYTQSRGFESEESVIPYPPTIAHAEATLQQQNVPERNSRRIPTRPQEYRPIAPVSASTSHPSEGETHVLPPRQEQSVQPLSVTTTVEADDREEPAELLLPCTEFRPLMPQDAAVVEPRLADAPFRAGIRASHDTHPAAAVERASDDIQIHIGRIEVTAVHAPAPRAPKLPDRSLSLDAYLKRRPR